MEEKKFYAYIDNSKEIELTRECVENCAHSGECSEDCERWVEMPEIAAQFKKINRETLINHIAEYGSEDRKELRKWSKKQLCVWVLWSVCFDILDSEDFINEEEKVD